MRIRNQLSCIPLRKENRDASEMVSQLLYGETMTVLEVKGKWTKVRCDHDEYEGWIANEHLPKPYHGASLIRYPHTGTLCIASREIRLSPGSLLDSKELELVQSSTTRNASSIIDYALLFLHSPYLWGGRTIWGIDCSGLTQICMACIGLSIPRDASQQIKEGEEVSIHEAQAGDLVFFQNDSGGINHVGLLMADKKIIHASGMVRIDSYTEQGIVREEDEILTHRFHSIRRYL